MNVKRWWLGILGGGSLAAVGLGALIYFELEGIDQAREQVAQTRTKIDAHRKLIQGTAALEREVIVLREMSEVIKGILPDDQDIYNLSRTFQRFSDEAGTRIRGLRQNQARGRAPKQQSAFEEVAYTITMEADAYQFLDFLDRLESHERFMRVPKFKIASAPRDQVEKEGYASHKISLDVETFVYDSSSQAKTVSIEGYDRKRDLLAGEINRRRQALSVRQHQYRGARGRRDPWVDPRVPVSEDGGSGLSVQEQMDLVQQLAGRTQAMLQSWEGMKAAQNVIEEMIARADLEQALGGIEQDVRRLQTDGAIRYVPSQRRLQLEVVDVVERVRGDLIAAEGGRGPSLEKLQQVLEAMTNHFRREEFGLMLEAYRLVDAQLDYIASDPARRPMVAELRRLARIATTVRDFEQIAIKVSGIAIQDGASSVALINGRALSPGDLLGNELLVHEITRDEIQFVFRGIILGHRF